MVSGKQVPKKGSSSTSCKGTRISVKKTRLFLRHGEPIGKGLKTLAALQLEAAMARLHGNNVSPEAIHQVRTYIKKVRAIIQLVSPVIGRGQRKHLISLLRDASSRIAPMRDSEVRVQSLDQLIEDAGLSADEHASLRRGLADSARQRRINDKRQIPRVIALLEAVCATVPEWRTDKLSGKDLQRRIKRTFRSGRDALDLYALSGDEDKFHEWRKLVKQLWYQLRITSRFWTDEARQPVTEAGSIGEIAGKERDFAQLAQSLGNEPQHRSADKLIDSINSILPRLRDEALATGEDFYKKKPASFMEGFR